MRSCIKRLCVTAFFAVVLFVAPSADAQSKDATLHLVVAGVSKYAPSSGQTSLALAHKDAEDMAAFWRQYGSKTFGRVLGASLLDEQATHKNITARLDETVEKARAGDWVVIFLAGHGGPYSGRGGKDWAFCAHDEPILGRQLQERVTRLADKKVTVLLILDCCFAGMMATSDTKAVVMAACQGGEVSGEPRILHNGQFTQALLAALRGRAVADKDGRITLAALRSYVTPQVARCSDNKQTPLFRVPEGMRDDLPVLAKPAPSTATSIGNGPVAFSPERVVAILKSKGHKGEVLPKGDQQGKIVAAVIEEDGWRYEVSIRFTTDGKGVWFSTVLRPADGLSVRQLQALMKKTSELACMDIFTIDADGRLCLETPNSHVTATQPFSVEEVFFQKLNRHLRTIRDSHDHWKTSK